MKTLTLTLTAALGLLASPTHTGNEPLGGIIIMNGTNLANARAADDAGGVADTGVRLAGARVEHGRLVR